MDPTEDRRHSKRQNHHINMLGFVADSEYGIPRRCPCGGRLINEVRGKEDYNTLPGKRFFTCKNYEADGFHYRQPWVIGVQEELERLTKRVEEAEQVMMGVSNLTKQIETLESSPPIDVDSAEPGVNSPRLVKHAERRKWSTKEDLVLISAWLNTSKDPIVSNEQKLGSFWKRIEGYFNSSPQLIGSAPREWGQCKQRWGRVNEQVCKFVGCHKAALKEQASGHSENDVMKAAHDIFFNDYKVKFTLEHCWRELRFNQKWRSNAISKEKRKEADAEVVPEEEEVRPPGVKASKAAKRKKPNQTAFDQIQSILAQKNTISKQKILDRLVAQKVETLSDQELALKTKLISEML
ncbi:PREDICTED: glutathione S-transferase T3-like [Brassica oleracea var. oleracea]|uniref:Myb-like domain-containing protein n=1 Tax=Brassica oleracea var. oleracea TaxID=109376 RepID=A0A0D3BLM8_BRAOL|nr:PREDICTED: glutathione S-transferase T3-like [Brassica oleracea var. oleracea]